MQNAIDRRPFTTFWIFTMLPNEDQFTIRPLIGELFRALFCVVLIRLYQHVTNLTRNRNANFIPNAVHYFSTCFVFHGLSHQHTGTNRHGPQAGFRLKQPSAF